MSICVEKIVNAWIESLIKETEKSNMYQCNFKIDGIDDDDDYEDDYAYPDTFPANVKSMSKTSLT